MAIVDNPPLFVALNATLFLLGYLIPTFIALVRRRDRWLAIFLLNLLAGWTVVGWMAAFLWAVTTPQPARRPPAHSRSGR